MFIVSMANYIATKHVRVFAIFILISIHLGCCTNKNCDVNHCKSLFPTVFNDFFKMGIQNLCRNSDVTIKCVDKCLQKFFPDFDFITSETSILSEVCSHDFQYDLDQNWNCIGGHFHRLLTCMSKFGSMTPTDISNRTLKLLSCKKFLEALNCPYEILDDCEEKASEILSKLLSKVFKPSMNKACNTISLNDAHDLLVTYAFNNSHLNTAACLDNLPDVAGNCITQYLQNFNSDNLYHCRNTCENLGEACLQSSLMNDFYIPVFSFGKHSCEDSTVEGKVQMLEPSKASTIIYNSDLASDKNSKNGTRNSADENDDLIPSDEAKTIDILSLDSNKIEASTLSYKLNEMNHNEVRSTIHSSNDFSSQTTMASSEVHPKINSLSSGYSVDNITVNNDASRFECCIQYLVASFICCLCFSLIYV